LKRKLVAAIACRNTSSRLYGKPIQILDLKKSLTVLDLLLKQLKNLKIINEIVLGISKEPENKLYEKIAKKHKIKYIYGDEQDVLSRLIKCGKLAKATDIFRVTSECPFLYSNNASFFWKQHVKKNYDATFLEEIVDGCGYEIIKLKALIKSHNKGQTRHRSEMCTLFIRENLDIFNVNKIIPPKKFIRKDLRLTVDYPEDLVVCREVYNNVIKKNNKVSLTQIIKFLDKRRDLKKMLSPYVSKGYKKMYL